MQACCDVAYEYVHARKQFNTRIGEFQLMQVNFFRWTLFYESLQMLADGFDFIL